MEPRRLRAHQGATAAERGSAMPDAKDNGYLHPDDMPDAKDNGYLHPDDMPRRAHAASALWWARSRLGSFVPPYMLILSVLHHLIYSVQSVAGQF